MFFCYIYLSINGMFKVQKYGLGKNHLSQRLLTPKCVGTTILLYHISSSEGWIAKYLSRLPTSSTDFGLQFGQLSLSISAARTPSVKSGSLNLWLISLEWTQNIKYDIVRRLNSILFEMMFYDRKAPLFAVFQRNGNIFVILGDVTQSTLSLPRFSTKPI